MSLIAVLVVVYSTCALLTALHALGIGALLLASLRRRLASLPDPPPDLPLLAVQLPIYNEIYVVERLLRAVGLLDLPQDRLIVQVLDDSDDATSDMIAVMVDRLRRRGLNIQHIHRAARVGYKAGALAHGLTLLPPECAYVAVFDADFVPSAGWLRTALAHLITDPRAAYVQTRWSHLNAGENWLTRAQALALDAHFAVEQTGRMAAGAWTNFSGSAGVWRIEAICAAGGWQADTLCEDLDLSYRAQAAGWRGLYLSEIAVSGELPTRLAAYQQQQARWARGGMQCLKKLLPLVWRSDLSIGRKLLATLHLAQYAPHLAMLTLLLLTPPLLAFDALDHLSFSVLGVTALIAPVVFIISQRALYADPLRRLTSFPALLLLGVGMTWNNSRAVWRGLFGGACEFRRTPKGEGYRVQANIGLEAVLFGYALIGISIALRTAPTFMPYLALHAAGYALVIATKLSEARAINPPPHPAQALRAPNSHAAAPELK